MAFRCQNLDLVSHPAGLYLLSISYNRTQFLLISKGFVAVKVTLLTMSLLFFIFLYELPHMAEEEQSFCELKITFGYYFSWD